MKLYQEGDNRKHHPGFRFATSEVIQVVFAH